MGDPVTFEKEQVDQETFLRVLDESLDAVDRASIAFVFIGSIPSVLLGRPRWSDYAEDIDYFVRKEDARATLDALADTQPADLRRVE